MPRAHRCRVATRLQPPVDLVLNRLDCGVGNDHRVRTSAAFAHPQDRDLADRATSRVQLFVFVLIGFQTADEALQTITNLRRS